MNEITLSPLPYADNALEPTISSRTVSFHYGKHHAGYVNTLKGLVAGTKYEGLSLGEIVVDVWEHAYYLDWQNQRAAYAKAVVEKHLDWSAASRRFGNV